MTTESADGLISAATWHKYKITRTPEGVFTAYLDNELVVALTGSNPFTDVSTVISNYMLLDLDPGDKVAWSDRGGGHSIKKRLLV